MKKRLLLGLSIIGFMAGCGQQPQLEVSTQIEKPKPKPVKKVVKQETKNIKQNKKEVNIKNKPLEENVVDTSVIPVINESVKELDNYQKLATDLSKEIVHFDFDKYNIRPDQMPIVKKVAEIIKNNNKGNYTVRIEGNCDEWGSDEYNYALGLKRAKTVKNALIDLGVDKNKLTIISYGESNPICTAHTKKCWAENRRDEFTLLP